MQPVLAAQSRIILREVHVSQDIRFGGGQQLRGLGPTWAQGSSHFPQLLSSGLMVLAPALSARAPGAAWRLEGKRGGEDGARRLLPSTSLLEAGAPTGSSRGETVSHPTAETIIKGADMSGRLAWLWKNGILFVQIIWRASV